ncbi:unnamed protein product [Heterobilharzia americana]|nr:unnamed protein product [Heterobilharzia americana]
MNYITLFTCLFLIAITAKELNSLSCYVCENCPTVNSSTPVETNCRRCLVNKTLPDNVTRSCVQSCPPVPWTVFRRRTVKCCKTDLCNLANKPVYSNLPIVSALSISAIILTNTFGKLCSKFE